MRMPLISQGRAKCIDIHLGLLFLYHLFPKNRVFRHTAITKHQKLKLNFLLIIKSCIPHFTSIHTIDTMSVLNERED